MLAMQNMPESQKWKKKKKKKNEQKKKKKSVTGTLGSINKKLV